jgi:hypothetical protein
MRAPALRAVQAAVCLILSFSALSTIAQQTTPKTPRPDAGVIDYAMGQRHEAMGDRRNANLPVISRENTDYNFAEGFYEKSANAGYAQAYVALAHMYETGKRGLIACPNDAAEDLYKKAVALGNPEAMRMLEQYRTMATIPTQHDAVQKLVLASSGRPGGFLPHAVVLGSSSPATPPVVLPQAQPVAPAGASPATPIPARISQTTKFRGINTNDRITISEPNAPVTLGRVAQMQVKNTGPGLKMLSISQQIRDHYGDWHDVDEGEQLADLPPGGTGNFNFSIVPVRLGKVQLRIVGIAADGEFSLQEFKIDVIPPPDGPTAIVVGFGGIIPDMRNIHTIGVPLVLNDSRPGHLYPDAFFDGVLRPVPIDIRNTNFTVRTSGGGEVISIDRDTGVVHPINPGNALIEASYGGLTKFVCVVVQMHSGWMSQDQARCTNLLGPNETDHPER